MLNEDVSCVSECVSEDGLCVYCRASPATTADHVFPTGACLRTPLAVSRLLPCCATCNSSKGKRELGLWMVNKFGFSNATIARVCELTAQVGADRAVEFGSPEELSRAPSLRSELQLTQELRSQEKLTQLRQRCYAFCYELHEEVVAMRRQRGKESLSSEPHRVSAPKPRGLLLQRMEGR
jgi:hypothetical protein